MHVSERNTSIMFCRECYSTWFIDWQKMSSDLYCGFGHYETETGVEVDRHSYCIYNNVWNSNPTIIFKHKLVVVNNNDI